MSQYLAVTVARQYGSGGREIGEAVAKLLACQSYDRELITMSAQKGDMNEDALARADEVAAGSLLYTLAMGSNTYGMHAPVYHLPINDKLFYLQSDIIKERALAGDSVFIGRCADYVLREHPRVLRVFIYAPEEFRIERIAERHENLPKNKASDLMRKIDHRRASYYNFYTGGKWGKHENYDLAINSASLGFEAAARLIAEAAKALKG